MPWWARGARWIWVALLLFAEIAAVVNEIRSTTGSDGRFDGFGDGNLPVFMIGLSLDITIQMVLFGWPVLIAYHRHRQHGHGWFD